MPRVRIAAIFFGFGAALIATAEHPRAQATTRFDTLYRSYATGNYDAIDHEIKTVADLNALNPPKPEELRKWLGAWDRAKAAFLLELAVAAGPISRSAQTALLSEGRLYVITRATPLGTSPSDDEFEVLWHKTAIAQLEGVPYLQAENLYLDTLDLRYSARRGRPKVTLDSRLAFQRAVAVEQYCWRAPEGIGGSLPPPPTTNTDNSVRVVGGQPLEIVPGIENKNLARFLTRKECLNDGAKRFAAVGASSPELAAEAFTRAAWLKAQLGSHKDALEIIDRAPETDDDVVTYWRHLFRARILNGLNRDDDAAREYRAALDAHASAHSANVGLALTLFKLGRVNEARDVAAAIRQTPADVVDPWWTYLAADARFVKKWVGELRGKIGPQGKGAKPASFYTR
jgi:tetratricopeptide (TPR) repeat protein